MLNTQLLGPEGLVLGHRTIDEIGRHTLPVSPQNYEVWLTYMTHSSPDLKQVVDKMLATGHGHPTGGSSVTRGHRRENVTRSAGGGQSSRGVLLADPGLGARH